MTSPNRSIQAGLGPLWAPDPAPTGTAPLTGTGVLNLSALGTVVTKVLSAAPGGIGGKIRKIHLICVTSGRVLAWSKVNGGASAPVITADSAGTSTNGALVTSEVYFEIPSNLDLYIVASASSTVAQLHVEEV